jgi:hypothetical protein
VFRSGFTLSGAFYSTLNEKVKLRAAEWVKGDEDQQ